MRRLLALLALLAFVAAVGCNKQPADTKKSEPDKPKVATKDEKKAPDEKKAAAAVETKVDVPTEEDFEDQAKKEITAKNLEKELKKIEKELD